MRRLAPLSLLDLGADPAELGGSTSPVGCPSADGDAVLAPTLQTIRGREATKDSDDIDWDAPGVLFVLGATSFGRSGHFENHVYSSPV